MIRTLFFLVSVLPLAGACTQTTLLDRVRNRYEPANQVFLRAHILENRIGSPSQPPVPQDPIPKNTVLRVHMNRAGVTRSLSANDKIVESTASPHWGITQTWVGPDAPGLKRFLEKLEKGSVEGNVCTQTRVAKRCIAPDPCVVTAVLRDIVRVNADGSIAEWILTAQRPGSTPVVFRHYKYESTFEQ